MSQYRKFFPLALAVLALGTGGCDTLKARARAQKGVEKYRNGDIKGAAQLFAEAAEIDPTVPPIIINRGFTHLSLYQLNPRTKEGVAAADIAIKSFKQYMLMPGLKPEQKQRARDYLLQTFVDARRYDEAVDYFKPLVERANPDIEALVILGNIAKSIGKNDASRMWIEKRVAANPKDTDGYVALAIMDWDELCNDSQCRTPMELRKDALKMPPEERIAKANHGIELLKKAVELSPNSPTPIININLLLRERSWAQPTDDLKRLDLEEAVKYQQQYVAMQKAATGVSTPMPAAAAPPDGGAPGDGGAAKSAAPATPGAPAAPAAPAAPGAPAAAPAAPAAPGTPAAPAAKAPAAPAAPTAPAAPAAPAAPKETAKPATPAEPAAPAAPKEPAEPAAPKAPKPAKPAKAPKAPAAPAAPTEAPAPAAAPAPKPAPAPKEAPPPAKLIPGVDIPAEE